MTILGWLGDFLEKRNCEDRRPDGRPLYAYRCTPAEFSEMKALLTVAEKVVLNNSCHLGYSLSTECLFTLYCAEWWRNSYKGGHWKWEPIKDSLGWSYCDWQTTADFVRKGLSYWKQDLISTGAGVQYLLSVAIQGGIPVNVLENQGAAFRSYLKAIIREYGQYAHAGLSAEKIAEEKLGNLPYSWRRPQIAILAGQLVEKVWFYKKEMGDVSDPVRYLNDSHPEWIDDLPVVLRREQAELLVRSLIQTAREASSGSSRLLRIERVLENSLNEWYFKAKILIPKHLKIRSTEELSSLTELPERMEMYRLAAGNRKLIAKLVKQDDEYSVRPVLGAMRAFRVGASEEQEVILVHRGNLVTSLPVVGGAALDANMPWCFVTRDDVVDVFYFVAQGGCKRREPSIYVLSNHEPDFQEVAEPATSLHVESLVNGKNFWRVDRAAIVQDDESSLYKIEPALQKVADRDYRLIGLRRYFPETKHPLFNLVPKIQWIEDSGVGYISHEDLVWRPIGTVDWHNLQNSEPFGDIEIRHTKNNIVISAWKLSILPGDIRIELEPISKYEGQIHFHNLVTDSLRIEAQESLNVTINDQIINCHRSDIGLTEIRGKISGLSNSSLHFAIPFPADGAAFVDSKGVEISQDIEISQSRMYGIRAQTMSLDSYKKYRFRGTILSSANQLSAIKHHWFEYDMIKDQSGMSTLPLQQVNEEINRLFALGTGIDDKVKLELLDMSNNSTVAKTIVKQFEGNLSVDLTSRIVTLTINPDLLTEYENSKLRVISINDFTLEPALLEWNGFRSGWSLPEFSEMDINHTYFATIDGEQSHLIRPCIIPGEGITSCVELSPLRRALLESDEITRLRGIADFLINLEEFNEKEDWLELRIALKRFSSIHPDGLDLVECLIDRPKLFATLWFYSVGDDQLKGYLQRIRETSPIDWWMIRGEDWLKSAQYWYENEIQKIGNLEVQSLLIQKLKSELVHFVDENEELNAVGDLILESLDEELPPGSAILSARENPPQMTWMLLDQLARGSFINEIGDAEWPVIQGVFELQKKIPKSLFEFIGWPVMNMGHQKSVIQAPVVAAAALFANVDIDINQRVALMAARNFHLTAFATSFRATQSTLWAHQEQQSVG